MRVTSFCYCFYPLLTVGNVAPAYKDINMIYITTLYFVFFLVSHTLCFIPLVLIITFQQSNAIEIPSQKPNQQIKLLFTVADASGLIGRNRVKVATSPRCFGVKSQ